jgi:shikimate dehydrogenase
MRHYGLIGKTLSHSFSQRYFSEKFARERIAARYDLHELPSLDGFPTWLKTRPEIAGLNVTIPYKTEMLRYVSALSPEAEAIGAVNTLLRSPEGLKGFNTDAWGFRISLERFLGGRLPPQALVLGSGGAARAACWVLGQMGIPFQIASRRPEAGQLAYEALESLGLETFPLIINSTPAGMYPDLEGCPPLPLAQLSPSHFVFDLIYNPEETRLLREARLRGARTLNGLEMLILQAEKAWEIWNA